MRCNFDGNFPDAVDDVADIGCQALANAYPMRVGKPPLERSPGIPFLQYGKNKDGYWTWEDFDKQCKDVMDVLEIFEPGYKLV